MNGKMKMCFTPHIYMHSLIGLGLGGLLTSLISGLQHWWIGTIVIVIGLIWHMASPMGKPKS